MSQPKSIKKGGANTVANTKCASCPKVVSDTDFALLCEICEEWHHAGCEDITDTEYKFLQNHASLHWYCKKCNKNIAAVIRMVSSLKQKQENLEVELGKVKSDLTDVKDEVKVLGSDVSKRDVEVSVLKETVTSLQKNVIDLTGNITAMTAEIEEVKKSKDLVPQWSAIVAKEVDEKMATVSDDMMRVRNTLEEVKHRTDEEKDKERRANNIIIYRVKESDKTREEQVKDDKQYCLELFNMVLNVEVKEDDLKGIFRLGKKNVESGEQAASLESGQTKDRPLLVQFRERAQKNRIMESLKRLSTAEDYFKNISINHDLTKTERAECRKLVAEAQKKQEDEQGEYCWRVRGAPGNMKIVRLQKH